MTRQPLRADQISVGAPLPFDAYDERGVLLLRRGSIIASAAQLGRLIESGLYSDDPAARRNTSGAARDVTGFVGKHVSVVHMLAEARTRLAAACAETGIEDFAARIRDIARFVRRAALTDPDVAIGDVVTSRGAHYPSRHAVDCAALSALLLERMEATEASIEACICAALTMNLGMYDLQATLYRQAEKLTPGQREDIRAHPMLSATMLRERGVDDAEWLDAVLEHHETLDGSGYPGGLTGDMVGRAARLLCLTDQYCALVSERAFRTGINPSAALRHLLLNKGGALDPALCALLVRELTPLPPGTVVRLANHELAVVTRRTRHPDQPIVQSLVAADGRAFAEPRKRVTSQDVFHIDKPIAQDQIAHLPAAEKLWDDSYTAP